MNKKQIDKIWTLSLTLVIVQTCFALWQTSQLGFEGVNYFIWPLLLISISKGLIKFQKKAWVFSWLGFFLLGYLINVFSQETAVGMIGSFILLLLIAAPISFFFLVWTKSIWSVKQEV